MLYKEKGNIGELAFLYRMSELGIHISIPYGDIDPYDFIIDINQKLYKIQVKTGKFFEDKNITCFDIKSKYYNCKVKKYLVHDYKDGDIDFYALYCIENKKLVLIPYQYLNDIKRCITINYNKKEENVYKWFYSDFNYKRVIKLIKSNKLNRLEKPHFVKKEETLPKYILDMNNSDINKAYKRAISSKTGYRGVTINDNPNSSKYKAYVSIGTNKRYFVAKGNNPKKLAKLHDKKAIELLGDNAITNKLLGLL